MAENSTAQLPHDRERHCAAGAIILLPQNNCQKMRVMYNETSEISCANNCMPTVHKIGKKKRIGGTEK